MMSARSGRGSANRLAGVILGVIAALLMLGVATSAAAPSDEAGSAIYQHYSELGGAESVLGYAIEDPIEVGDGASQDYDGGTIFYSPHTGAFALYGPVLEKYRALGGPIGSGLGFPISDETNIGEDHTGRVVDFAHPGGAAIVWSPESGAFALTGRVLEAWRASGGPDGHFGYPTSDATEIDGVTSAEFSGPVGYEIRWSAHDGLMTSPDALVASIPGFGPEEEGIPALPGQLHGTPAEADHPGEGAEEAEPEEVWIVKRTVDWGKVGIGGVIAAVLAALALAMRAKRNYGKVPVLRTPDDVKRRRSGDTRSRETPARREARRPMDVTRREEPQRTEFITRPLEVIPRPPRPPTPPPPPGRFSPPAR